MPNALLTGVSGLLVHQRMLDTTANNLANMNTIAFKSRRILFSDLDYEVIQPATSAGGGAIGGTNPNELGSGVRVAQISKQMSQGNLDQTGEVWDIAISGNGFFTASNGNETLYTRAGAFSLDSSGYLVDPATGYRVQRFGTVGEPDGVNPTFQTPGDNGIYVPLGLAVPGQETTTVGLSGNLPSNSPTSTPHTLASPQLLAGGVPATGATLLNSLVLNSVDYVAGDAINITGTNSAGAAVSATFNVTATSTVQDLVNAIDAAYGDATATLSASGVIQLNSDVVGPSSLTLNLADAAGNTGDMDNSAFNWSSTAGAHPAPIEVPIEVFDEQGGAHTLKASFLHVGANTWNMTITGDVNTTITGGVLNNIVFTTDGSGLAGSSPSSLAFTASFSGSPNQNLTINLAPPTSGTGNVVRFTQVASPNSVQYSRDGYGAGVLQEVRIQGDGTIELISTQDNSFRVAQIAISNFANPQGLTSAGENYYKQSVNSGVAQVGAPSTGGRGALKRGHLEQSNVDVALEFTRLIVAQRGFSANARTITVADQVLQELTNVIR